MRDDLQFMSLVLLGMMLCILGAALDAPKPITGSLVTLFIGSVLFGSGWAVVNTSRPHAPPTNITQWWFWQLETLPALPRTIVGRVLQILGVGLWALSVVWTFRGPIPAVARLGAPLGVGSFILLLSLAIVLQLRAR